MVSFIRWWWMALLRIAEPGLDREFMESLAEDVLVIHNISDR